MEYKFLIDIDFDLLHQTFLEAFSDYIAPLQLTRERLQEMLIRRGAGLNLSAGAFDEGRLVGFTLNALDDFCGQTHDLRCGNRCDSITSQTRNRKGHFSIDLARSSRNKS